MNPVNFKFQNGVLSPPKGMEEEVVPLPIFHDGEWTVSCWEVTDAEIEEISKTKRVWLAVQGKTHPPLSIMGLSPLKEQSDEN